MAKNMCVSSTWNIFSWKIRFRGVRALKMDIEDFGADWRRCKSGTYSSQIRQRDTTEMWNKIQTRNFGKPPI